MSRVLTVYLQAFLLTALLLSGDCLAQSANADGTTGGSAKGSESELKAKANIHGGLCLVIGADNPAVATALATESALYVQILQSDPKLASAWGSQIAASPLREQIGVRSAAFDPNHYGSDLLNLIVVYDRAALGKATLADLARIATPRGVIAFSGAAGSFAGQAKALGMTPIAVEGSLSAFRKPVRPTKWKLPLANKWQAGPRSQIARGFTGICTTDGKLFYLERIELDEGTLEPGGAMLVARDAYNGRTLWSQEVGKWGGNALSANRKGHLFVKMNQDIGKCKIRCLDGSTGKTLFEIPSAAHRAARIECLNDDLLSVGGQVYSTETGQFLWKFPFYRYQPMQGTIVGENIYFSEGTTLDARKLADGKQLWKKPLAGVADPKAFASMSRAGDNLLIRLRGNPQTGMPICLIDSATGKLLWSYTWPLKFVHKGDRYFRTRSVKCTTDGDTLLMYCRHNKKGVYADEVIFTRLDLATGKVIEQDHVLEDAGDYHGCFPEVYLGDYIAYYDLWIHKKTLKSTLFRMPHPACFFGMSTGNGLVYNFPSRKSGPISAVGPSDYSLPEGPGGKLLQTFAATPAAEATKPGDWPMFRGSPAGGNACSAPLGSKFVKMWEAAVGVGNKNFGLMSSQRTGLTQAVSAYGLVVVADIDGQQIVALGSEDGKRKWAFHVGSRVDFSPTLYNGLCLFAARDGWVYCLDAKTGSLVWKLLVPPQQRYIGGREKLESVQPLRSDVLIVDGVAYVSSGSRGLAFRPETGTVVDAKDAARIATGDRSITGGRDLQLSYDMLLKGNSIPRTNEDNKHGFRRAKFGRRLDARVLVFDDTLSVAYTFKPRGEGWANKGTLHIVAVDKDPNKPLWKSEPIELVVDDMVLTPKYVYCAGHYQRIKKDPELWVLSRKDGKVVSKMPVDGFPAFFGLSATGNELFVATREGKLICYKSAE